jgi:hypothetical protein
VIEVIEYFPSNVTLETHVLRSRSKAAWAEVIDCPMWGRAVATVFREKIRYGIRIGFVKRTRTARGQHRIYLLREWCTDRIEQPTSWELLERSTEGPPGARIPRKIRVGPDYSERFAIPFR